MDFFKSIWKSGKHNKLEYTDEKILEKNTDGELPSPVQEVASCFCVKYLGSTIVSTNTTIGAAVDMILNMAKAGKHKRPQVLISITLNGITVSDSTNGSLLIDASIYRISNCSLDHKRRNIFTFFAVNKNEIPECHAFKCKNKKMAKTVTISVANSFKVAYDTWQRGHEIYSQLLMEQTSEKPTIKSFIMPSNTQLIDLSDEKVNQKSKNISKNWVCFDNDSEESSKGFGLGQMQMEVNPVLNENHIDKLNLDGVTGRSDNFFDDSAWL